jgi:hypothetical protein
MGAGTVQFLQIDYGLRSRFESCRGGLDFGLDLDSGLDSNLGPGSDQCVQWCHD